MMKRLLVSALCSCSFMTGATAHEFWISPAVSHVADTAQISARLLVGQDFRGMEFPYLSNRFVSFSVADRFGSRPYTGRDGDTPAITITEPSLGMHVFAYQSTADRITFEFLSDFIDYVTYEGNLEAVRQHLKDGLPRRDFSEKYTRYAKGLLQVGPVSDKDADAPLGLPIELVALNWPYASETGLAGAVSVQLLWQGQPLANQRINVFRNSDGVIKSIRSTDANGIASIPINDGGYFMLNAVKMERAPEGSDVVWKSHWASLTYEITSTE